MRLGGQSAGEHENCPFVALGWVCEPTRGLARRHRAGEADRSCLVDGRHARDSACRVRPVGEELHR